MVRAATSATVADRIRLAVQKTGTLPWKQEAPSIYLAWVRSSKGEPR
jgi:hypothetical protein